MTFISMKTSLHDHYDHTIEAAEKKSRDMARNGGDRKVRDVRVLEDIKISQKVSQAG